MTQDETRERARATGAAQAQKILIVGGRGRMGLWLSEFFESFGHAVSHYDPSATAAPSPYPLVADLETQAAVHDVVAIAAPISATPELIRRLTASRTEALVFDICSLKTPLVAAIRDAAAAGLRITSVHPMFGPQVAVLAGRNIIICDTGDPELTARTRQLFEGTTASLVDIPLERHDRLMSYVLGLSHLTNLVFAQVLAASGEPFQQLSAVSSTTFNAQLGVAAPVAAENPDLYYEIQAENRFTPELVAALAQALAAYGDAIAARDRGAFKALMDAGRRYLG
jgi:chorismate mutase/prephenate dehydrogenase